MGILFDFIYFLWHNLPVELENIKGLGKKRIQTLQDKGIDSVEKLALYFPKAYFDLNSKDVFLEDGKTKLLCVSVVSEVKIVRIRANFSYSVCDCLDLNSNKFKAVWYNQPFIKNAVSFGDVLYIYGKNSSTKHNYFVVSSYKNKNKIKENTNILPIYKNIGGLGQTVLASAVEECLKIAKFDSILPYEEEKKFFDLTYAEAIKLIHNPYNDQILKEAKERIDIERILPVIKFNHDLKSSKNAIKEQKYMDFQPIIDKFHTFLPFKLTSSQLSLLNIINKDLNGKTKMNRLIQGDVGSGKTIIALITCAVCSLSGNSSLFVAPTEILAKQHYNQAVLYFNKLGLDVCFLSASVSKQEKQVILDKLKQGKPLLIIGTQACLNDQIEAQNLSLVVIDEQHRFGVAQRAKLVNKCVNTDLLMLSATPIPRSLSLVYYGGLDVSILEKPPKEKQIQTNIVSVNKEHDMWNFVEQKINDGSKVYVVCANIDDSDDDGYLGLSVKAMFDFLKDRFGENQVLMAHGKQDSLTENKILNQFKEGNYHILVSTTIVEVGVDIKNADIMIIVSPEKFGLATLHQLRGRVGRAGQQSFCFCLSRNFNEMSFNRVKYFKEHNNGFDIAEFDYQSRGAGNILTTKQHGKVENIFGFISLETYKKAQNVFEKINQTYDTSLFYQTEQYAKLLDIVLN